MESDRRYKPKGLQKVDNLEKLPQEYEGYHHTYVKKQNIVCENTRTVKTNRIPNHLQYEKNNLHSDTPNINNQYSDLFPRVNRRMERDFSSSGEQNFLDDQYSTKDQLHQTNLANSQDNQNYNRHMKSRYQYNLSGHSPTHSNRVDEKNTNNSARYNMSDETYADNSRSINHNRMKTNQQANFVFVSEPDHLMSQTNKDSSLICRAINADGKPISVNNKIVTNKLILCCKPNHNSPENILHTPGVSIENKHSLEEQVTSYEPIDQISSIKSPKDPYESHHSNKPEINYSFISLNQAKYDLSKESVGTDRIYNQNLLKDIECKKYFAKFRSCLWTLFIASTLLAIVGIVLGLVALYHHIFRYYLSIVIGETGFVTWMWVVLLIALLIIIVGIVGIITSMTRTKPMLKIYLVLAIILLAIVILATLIFAVQYSNLKKEAMSETDRTFLLYRCVRRIRNAWDDMMEVFHCCGKDDSKDWKYIPPACCNATSKPGKLACIGHFIQPSQAFEKGCKSFILSDYLFLHTESLILLLIAILILIIGILSACKLHQMYPKLLVCREHFFTQ